MSGPVVLTAQYGAEEIIIRPAQVLRYLGMGGKQPDDQMAELVEKCVAEFKTAANYKVCWLTADISVEEAGVAFGFFYAPGKSLAHNLKGCKRAILFAATTGMQAEQQRRRAAVASPARALVLDAVGTAAVEALCDHFCADRRAELGGQGLRPRFSPGYGDLPLQLQRELLACLDSHRKIGLSLSASMMMTPQKSVTAICGIGREGCSAVSHDCEQCEKRDCAFRL